MGGAGGAWSEADLAMTRNSQPVVRRQAKETAKPVLPANHALPAHRAESPAFRGHRSYNSQSPLQGHRGRSSHAAWQTSHFAFTIRVGSVRQLRILDSAPPRSAPNRGAGTAENDKTPTYTDRSALFFLFTPPCAPSPLSLPPGAPLAQQPQGMTTRLSPPSSQARVSPPLPRPPLPEHCRRVMPRSAAPTSGAEGPRAGPCPDAVRPPGGRASLDVRRCEQEESGVPRELVPPLLLCLGPRNALAGPRLGERTGLAPHPSLGHQSFAWARAASECPRAPPGPGIGPCAAWSCDSRLRPLRRLAALRGDAVAPPCADAGTVRAPYRSRAARGPAAHAFASPPREAGPAGSRTPYPGPGQGDISSLLPIGLRRLGRRCPRQDPGTLVVTAVRVRAAARRSGRDSGRGGDVGHLAF